MHPGRAHADQQPARLRQHLPDRGHLGLLRRRRFPTYVEIRGDRLGDLRPGHRVDPESGGAKRFHADSALCKSAGTDREMVWHSQWSTGPGLAHRVLGDELELDRQPRETGSNWRLSVARLLK